MASKKQSRGFDVRQSILMVYVGICVIAVVLTVVIAFGESSGTTSKAQPTPTLTRTLSPLILTQQSEGSMNDASRHTQSPAQNSGGAVEPDSEIFIPTATPAPGH